MAYDSPFSGAYGGAGSGLPAGYMQAATQPGRDVQGLLKSIGEKFKERREKKKQEAKELKATRSLAKALGVERIGMDDSSIETADIDTIMGKIQAMQAKNKERELAVKEAPGKQDKASMQMIQQALGSEAEGLATRREAPFVAQGGPLDEQGEARLQGLQNLLPAIEQNLGAHPEMVETIMALSQGGGSGAGSVQQGPGGSLLLQTGKGTFSVLKGVDKPESPADVALARQRNASAKSDELYHELLEGIKGEKVNTSGMSEQDKRTVVKLESEIEQSQNNIEMLEGLRKKNVSYANWDGEEVVGEAEVDEISMFNAVIGEKSTSSSLTSEKQKLKKLQKQLNKLRGESGGAAIPAPPLSFDDSPENLFAE